MYNSTPSSTTNIPGISRLKKRSTSNNSVPLTDLAQVEEEPEEVLDGVPKEVHLKEKLKEVLEGVPKEVQNFIKYSRKYLRKYLCVQLGKYLKLHSRKNSSKNPRKHICERAKKEVMWQANGRCKCWSHGMSNTRLDPHNNRKTLT